MKHDAVFQQSVLKMQPNLLAFARQLTSDRDEANDLVQETTLKALNSADKFVDESNFKGWMLTIMRNTYINNYNRAARRNTVVDTTPNQIHLNLVQDSGFHAPDGMCAVNEITKLIAAFPAEYREPFNMHVAGYKYEEIAEQLAMPLGTVKSHIFYTRKRLRELLKDYR